MKTITAEKAAFILESARSAILTAGQQGMSPKDIKDRGLAVVEALLAVDSEIQKAIEAAS
jgi:hypothetical protein